MTIRNMEAFISGLWDWAVLDGCFGSTRICPTDVDGLVERHGCFLFLEAKPDGGELTKGQRITFENLSRQPRTAVLVFCGDPEAQTVSSISYYWNGETRTVSNPSLKKLRHLVSRWYQWANNSAQTPN